MLCNVDLLWIMGSEVIRCQSPKILTPDLAEPRDWPTDTRLAPYGRSSPLPRYELTPGLLYTYLVKVLETPSRPHRVHLVPSRAHLGSYSLCKPPPLCYKDHCCFGHCTVSLDVAWIASFGLSLVELNEFVGDV